jgi:osmotically-inducible protein OsmY
MRGSTTKMQRTDADIFVEARGALDRCANVPATVRVHVDNGCATLTGSVRLPSERSEAEDAVRRVKGIHRFVNHITVSQVVSAEGFEPPEEEA